MTFQVGISYIICIFAILLAALCPIEMADTSDVEQFHKGLERFGTRLFAALAEKNAKKNIVFSPFSIQTCIAMARMGAEGQTALEIDQTLALSSQKAENVAEHYHTILSKYENSTILKMANKIYAMTGFDVQDEFNQLLTKKFYSAVDSLNFADNRAAAQTINTWVEGKTNNLIQNLVDPSLFDETTRLVLVNAIHFKGNWEYQFRESNTREMDFYLDDIKTTKVQMMHTMGDFMYADLPDLDAKALEMPYKDSDLAMLIILPNKRTGLADLEHKLNNTSLTDITTELYPSKVSVDLPKFKAEFQAELSEPLSKMGMKKMFSEAAEFGKMLKSSEGLRVSSVIHKAFIEVNERGTEAAAATGHIKRAKRSLVEMPEIEEFHIEHPFLFWILQRTVTSTPASRTVLFAAKIENIDHNVVLTKTKFTDMKDEL